MFLVASRRPPGLMILSAPQHAGIRPPSTGHMDGALLKRTKSPLWPADGVGLLVGGG